MRIIAAVVIACIASTTSYGQAPKPAEKTGTSKNQPAPRTPKAGSKESPIFIGGEVTTAKTKEDSDREDKEGKEQANREWAAIYVSGGAAGIALLALLVALWQLGVAAATAKKQLRAYLGVTPQDIRILEKNHLQTYIEVLNTGSTPAKKVRQWTKIEIRPPATKDPFPLDEVGYGVRPIVPGAKWLLGMEMNTTDQQFAALQMQMLAIFVWGRVEYEDIYGEHQWLTFRYRNIGTVYSQDQHGNKALLGWALLPEPEGNESS